VSRCVGACRRVKQVGVEFRTTAGALAVVFFSSRVGKRAHGPLSRHIRVGDQVRALSVRCRCGCLRFEKRNILNFRQLGHCTDTAQSLVLNGFEPTYSPIPCSSRENVEGVCEGHRSTWGYCSRPLVLEWRKTLHRSTRARLRAGSSALPSASRATVARPLPQAFTVAMSLSDIQPGRLGGEVWLPIPLGRAIQLPTAGVSGITVGSPTVAEARSANERQHLGAGHRNARIPRRCHLPHVRPIGPTHLARRDRVCNAAESEFEPLRGVVRLNTLSAYLPLE